MRSPPIRRLSAQHGQLFKTQSVCVSVDRFISQPSACLLTDREDDGCGYGYDDDGSGYGYDDDDGGGYDGGDKAEGELRRKTSRK